MGLGGILAACVGLRAADEAVGDIAEVALDLLFKGAGREVMDSVAARLHSYVGGVPPNHDLEHAIRLAELTSTAVLLEAARRQIEHDQHDMRDARMPPFIVAARRWLHAQIGACPALQTIPNDALVAELEAQLDHALAATGREELRAILKAAEREVWNSLTRGAAENGGGDPPTEFRGLFFGDDKKMPGWPLVFQAMIREALKHNPRAEIAFVTTRLASVRSTLARLEPKIDQIQRTVDRIEAMLTAGAAHLSLDQRHRLRPRPENERELLLTELRATTLVGREADLVALQAWLDAPRTIAARCITGQAGAGKTRLALELCERAENARWAVGFARQAELERFHTNHSPSDSQWPCKTLVVVDYAAASVQILRPWLEVLARRPDQPAPPKLRVLLLERYADPQTGWWAELIRPGGSSGRDPRDVLEPAAPMPLHPLAEAADRRALLTEVMAEAARIAGITPPPVPPPPGADALFDQRLEKHAIETEPLFLMMAGIVGVRKGAPAALALSRLELADQLANADEIAGSERNRLIRLARSAKVNENLLLHVAACVTLQQGCDTDSAQTLVEQECAAFGASGETVDNLTTLLHDALAPPVGGGVDAVRPDLIGEAFLLHVI